MSNKKQNPLLKAAASFNSVSNPPNLDNISKKTSKNTANDGVENKLESKEDVKIKSNVKINDDFKIKSNDAVKDPKSVLEDLLNSTEKEKKRPLTVYLDQDVWDLLDEFAKPRGKGAKSEVVNQLLKNTFNPK
ncbi:hypothetical protein M3221_25305 [Domibacillus indicus]|uniref:hypothetical protein n=1 Tax=Domibacillus indicus TaxID=1437523 RepID=UPI002041DBA3|nr:hypothetical protein [Domibacillus indicus]MCM3791613.1 hypothetical protein [Domibacillus indicus]